MINGPKYHDILGVKVTGSNQGEVLKIIDQVLMNKPTNRPFFVVTANPEIVMLAQDDDEYRKVLRSADYVFADGAGLKLAGVSEVVPGRSLVEEICQNRDYRLFFLGGKDEVSRLMAEKYSGQYDPGESDIKSLKRNKEVIKKINDYKPDVLFVAYGAPWQEKWIWANLDKLKCKVVMGVGGAFDYLVGQAKLPPAWMEKFGLEWLWRLVQEPWRWRRQLRLVKFVWRIIISYS